MYTISIGCFPICMRVRTLATFNLATFNVAINNEEIQSAIANASLL